MAEDQNAVPADRRKRKFWGWGYADQVVSKDEKELIGGAVKARMSGHDFIDVGPPEVSDFDLRAPRVHGPESLSHVLTDDAEERLAHAYGKSYADTVRMFMRDVPSPPDLVAFPRTEQDVVDLLDWAEKVGAAVIPFGGGTSVCGGVETDVGGEYKAVISVDLTAMDQILEIDQTSRAARFQAGILGPDLEAGLKPYNLTLRHFPQSFEFSTLGGWIVTRSGGHYASLYTHIDDFVEATRTVTPDGILETRRLPGSGAGPSADRLVIGSEGIFGIVTEAWMRLQDRPTFRGSAAVKFTTMKEGAQAVRALSQSALYPTNCRLIDSGEAGLTGAGDGSEALLVLGFESADHPLDAWMARALELAGDHGGRFDQQAVDRSLTGVPKEEAGEHRQGAAGQWRNAFIRAPYYREVLVGMGVIVDTFESAITWDKFEVFHDKIIEGVHEILKRVTGNEGSVTCRFTHIYPDGPAPYFTFQVPGKGDLARILAQWCEIKQETNLLVTQLGGTITHHHAVGRDHRSGYESQTSALFRETLCAAKHRLDPDGIMNPGVLIDPMGQKVGIRGALGGSA